MDPCRIRLDPRSSGITFSSNEFRFQPGTGGSGGDKGPTKLGLNASIHRPKLYKICPSVRKCLHI